MTDFTLAKVGHFLFAPDETVYPDLKKLCDTVSVSYRDRVVVELLQNAHDAHPADGLDGRIKFILDETDGSYGTLLVANGGNVFSKGNFEALCSPTRTTKTVNEAIGNKGVGFLSTFQVCGHPEIHSRTSSESTSFDGFSFRFGDAAAVASFLADTPHAEHSALVSERMPQLYLPCPSTDQSDVVMQLAVQGYSTVIKLRLKNAEALASVQDQLDRLAVGDPPVQLFLTRIRELAIERDGQDPVVLERHASLLHETPGLRLLDVDCTGRRYILAQRLIPFEEVMLTIRRDLDAQALPGSWADWEGDAVVSLAVARGGEPLQGQMYNFLPMGATAAAPFAGHLDAPFYATIERLNVQSGVALNDMFLATARALALDAAQGCKVALEHEVAGPAICDLLSWKGDGREQVLEALDASREPLVPVMACSVEGPWATIKDLRQWPEDEFISVERAAAVSTLSFLNPGLGAARLKNLETFAKGMANLVGTWSERGKVIEGVARQLHREKAPIAQWNLFYSALTRLVAQKPDTLLGLKVLLTERRDLEVTSPPNEVAGSRRKRSTRLSSVFLPPLRGGDGRADLPRAIRQRLAFLHHELELCRVGSHPARSLLLAAGVVREHQAREILRVLARAIDDTGAANDPEALRWDALKAMMRIASDEDVSDAVILETNVRVPGQDGWVRADAAYFGRGWQGTSGARLDDLFEQAQGLSADLDAHAKRRLRPYRDWHVGSGDIALWVTFLKKAGVLDRLRPELAFTGAALRSETGPPFDEMQRRAALPTDQAAAWANAVGSATSYPNPYTPYTLTQAYRLPGQADLDALAPVIGRSYAEQVVRVAEAAPEQLKMRLYRPQHPSAPHSRDIPSPIAAFIRGARWIPTAAGWTSLKDAWLNAEGRTAPPGLPIIDYDFRTQLLRHPETEATLKEAGLATFGTATSAWRFLQVAGKAIAENDGHGAAERWLSASQDAWARADLKLSPPSSLSVIGRQQGAIVSVRLAGEGPLLVLADGDDRQLLAATMQAPDDAVLFEPPASNNADVASYLERHFAARVLRVSTLQASYETSGQPVQFDAADPTVIAVLGERLREIVALTLRYGNNFYRGDREEALARLAVIRLRWLDNLAVRVGDLVEPLSNFIDRAVLLRGPAPTLLVHSSLQGSHRLLVRIADALAEGLGSRRLLAQPLMAFAAQLDEDPFSSSYDDFARVLRVPEAQVRAALGVTRAAVGNLLAALRPFVWLYCDEEAAGRFVPGAGLLTEEDVLAALAAHEEELPEPAEALIARARDAGGVRGVALGLRCDLSALNAVLIALGPPYDVIDMTIEHAATLQLFLDKRAGMIRDSIRATFRSAFEAGGPLDAYVLARDAPRPVLPWGFGQEHGELTGVEMAAWLEDWFETHGITMRADAETGRQAMEQVQEANLRLLRQISPRVRLSILASSSASADIRAIWAVERMGEQTLVAHAEEGGWIDFDRLDADQALAWMARAELWPADWPTTLDLEALGLDEAALEQVRSADEHARIAAAVQPRTMAWANGRVRLDLDSWGSLADEIATFADVNEKLLATTTRVVPGTAPFLRTRAGSNGGGGGGAPRMSEEERELVGFFGEAIAFRWLKHRFSKGRVVDDSCWKSSYRKNISSRDGDNMLGYDFEIGNGGTRWFFEVKATSAASPRPQHSIDLGSTEIAWAEQCKAEGRLKYRILYVVNALDPAMARLFVLPNPRSEEGRRFFAEPATTGLRLVFGLPD